MITPDDEALAKRRRRFRIAAMIGIVAALLCDHLPAPYSGACHAITKLCTGGF